MEGMSSEDEDHLFSSDEEGEHNVENIMLCSFAHHACSPLLQGFLYEEEALDVIFLCQGCASEHFMSQVGCGRNSTAGKETPWPTHHVSTEELVGHAVF